MTTIANEVYNMIDVDSSEGVYQQMANICSSRLDVESFTDKEVVFTDGSVLSYDDYSITS
jgi:hypothetical protein